MIQARFRVKVHPALLTADQLSYQYWLFPDRQVNLNISIKIKWNWWGDNLSFFCGGISESFTALAFLIAIQIFICITTFHVALQNFTLQYIILEVSNSTGSGKLFIHESLKLCDPVVEVLPLWNPPIIGSLLLENFGKCSQLKNSFPQSIKCLLPQVLNSFTASLLPQ